MMQKRARTAMRQTITWVLALALALGLSPVWVARAGEARDGTYDPKDGGFAFTFGFETASYANVNIYTATTDGMERELFGTIARDIMIEGMKEFEARLPEDTEVPVSPAREIEEYIYGGARFETGNEYMSGSVSLRETTLHWDGTVDGYQIVGPDLLKDEFILIVQIEPLGRPDFESYGCEYDPETGGHISCGKHYTWCQDEAYCIEYEILVQYRAYNAPGEGAIALLIIKSGISASEIREIREAFFNGSMTCPWLTEHPELADLIMDHNNLEPVDMVTGAYFFGYTDLRLEGMIPLTFRRIYNSRYEGGGLGNGFSHSYEYRMREERGMVRVIVPGGEEALFIRLRGGGYKKLEDSLFTLEDSAGGGYVMTHEQGAKLYFDAGMKLYKVANPSGVTVATLGYSGEELTEICGIAGTMTLSWTGGHISKVTDSAGRSVSYTHDGSMLTGMENPDGDSLAYEYDANGYISGLYDYEGTRYLTNTYDAAGRVTAQAFKAADKEMHATVAYDDENRANTCTDFYGRETVYHYDENRGILLIADADGGKSNSYTNSYATGAVNKQGGSTSYTLDAEGRVSAVTYPDGTGLGIGYSAGNLVGSITDELGGVDRYAYDNRSVTSHTDKNGNAAHFTYNGLWLPETVTDALGNTTTYRYDAAGRLTSVTDAEGGATAYTYDGAGRIKTSTVKISETVYATTEYVYSSAGKLLSVIDALGNETKYEYDANGYSIKSTDALGGTHTTEYGASGQPLSTTDANGNTTTYTYNANGRVEAVTDALGNSVRYYYNDKGMATETEDAAGYTVKSAYDVMGNLVKTTDAYGYGTEYTYDSMQRVTAVTDANGGVTEYTYDPLGRRATVTNAMGGRTSYEYDPCGNLLKVTDAEGVSTARAYDKLNRISTATDGEGNITAYSYDKTGRLLTVTDAEGGVASFAYDLAGNMLASASPEGLTTYYEYDLLGRAIKTVGPGGGGRGSAYDALGRLTESSDELGNRTSYTYDPMGNTLTVTDPLGYVTGNEYDANNRLTATVYPDGGVVRYTYGPRGLTSSVADQLGNTAVYAYDALGRSLYVTDAAGVTVGFSYDPVGNVVETKIGGQMASRAEYDALGRAVKTYDGNNNPSLSEYSMAGALISHTDREGGRTAYTYDRNYRVKTATDAEGGVKGYTYDKLGRVVSVKDANGNVSRTGYDRDGRVISSEDALGGRVENTYGPDGRLLHVKDKLGAVTSYTYDAAGNMVAAADAYGGVSRFTYDKNGNLTSFTNRNNETARYEYDRMNRQVKATNGLNHSDASEYDLAGNLVAYTDRNKNRAVYEYDAIGRLASSTDAEGQTAEYTYNRLGMTATMTTYGGNGQKATTSYTYDAAGNMAAERSPLGYETHYEYDKQGNTLKKTDRNGNTTEYAYDRLHRVTQRTGADGVASYTYDAESNMLTAINAASAAEFGYDALYRLTRAEENGHVTTYTYDAGGNRLSIVYPDGKAASTEYDMLGRAVKLTDHDGTGPVYTRDAEGRITKEAHPDGSTTEYAYNAAGLLTQQKEVDKNNSTRREVIYGYDDEGNLRSELRSGIDTGNRDESVRYYYDRANRLIRTVIEGAAENYTYDRAGNMLTKGPETYSYDLQNRLTGKAGPEGATSYTYDAAGNLTGQTGPGGTAAYVYDAQNRLVRGEPGGGQYSEYVYNALGARVRNVQYRINANAGHSNIDLDNGSRYTPDYTGALGGEENDWQRVWETEAGTTVQYSYETVTKDYIVDYRSPASRDIMVYEAGSYVQRYVYAADGARLSVELSYAEGTRRGEGGANIASDFAAEDIQKIWYRRSLLGSSLFAVDKEGDVVIHAIYGPWGAPLTEPDPGINYAGIDNITNFTGYTWDVTLGLYYAQARFYSAADHRFTQEDTARDGVNWYAYCANNPVIYVDPTGTEGELPWDNFGDFFHDVKSDSQGRDILWHWLYGKGKDFIKDNNKSWAKYMTDNDILQSKIQSIVTGYMSRISCGGSMSFNETLVMEIQNGEQMIGYQYLHGTNADVGGFVISGTIVKNANGAATISLTYTWNDIIDPNFIYDTDSAKAKFAQGIPFANPTDYTIRISWADVSTTDASGNFTSGWLAGKWKYIKNPDHSNVSPPPMPMPTLPPSPMPGPSPSPTTPKRQ